MMPAATTRYGAMRQANSRAPRAVRMRRSVMKVRQNSGNASSDSTRNCGRHPATSAMQSDPATYHAHACRERRPRIQQ